MRLQSNQAALIFSSVILPLVPAGFVASLLGHVLFVGYCQWLTFRCDGTTRSPISVRVANRVQLGFERTWLRSVHETLTVVGIATSESQHFVWDQAAHQLATGFLAIALALAVSTASQAGSRARWTAETHPTSALWLLSCGLLLAGIEVALALADETFGIILTRRLLEAASRVFLTIGLVGSYYPSNTSARQGVQLPMDRPKRSREVTRSPGRPIRPSISGPVIGSFSRMSEGATKSFHSSPRAARESLQHTHREKEGDRRQRSRVVMRDVSTLFLRYQGSS